MAGITKTITLYGDKERRVALPARWCICDGCRGEGKSSAYLGAYTADEMDEAGPEFEADYFAGAYDRPCEECDGTGKVLRIDRKRISEHGDRVEKAYLRAYDEQERAAREIDRISEMERRMGA